MPPPPCVGKNKDEVSAQTRDVFGSNSTGTLGFLSVLPKLLKEVGFMGSGCSECLGCTRF